MNKNLLDKIHKMSPFETKDLLIDVAQKSFKKNKDKTKKYINAGRGNPNFFNTTARKAFTHFMHFAVDLAESSSDFKEIAFRCQKDGLYSKYLKFIKKAEKNPSLIFLDKAINWAIKNFKYNKDEFMFELVDAVIGDFYPMPYRILPCIEKIVIEYLFDILAFEKKDVNKYEIFATEGATAGMIYIFNSLKYNKLINPKDKIGIITPIFTPYLEIPELFEFQLKEIFIETQQEDKWEISDEELEKIKDPNMKAIFMVNPANPASVSFTEKTIDKVVNLIKKHRKDLIVIIDSVYANFIYDFKCLEEKISENIISVYSF